MNAAEIALLVGLFGAPAALLWLGHGLRHRGRTARGAFRGAVIGHSLALLVTLAAAFWPPALWQADSPRAALVFWSMATAPLIGAVAGAAVARRRLPP